MLLLLSNIFSSISVHHLCCALRPNQLSKILPSLMLPSKIFRALFQHSTFFCCAPKISLRFLNILPSSMLCSKMFSSISLHSTISDAILQGVLFNFWASAMLCSKILFFFSSPPSLMLRFKIFSSTYKILPSLMLCSKVFSPMFKHHRCYAIRLLFNFLTSFMLRCQIFWSVCLTFHHHGWYAIGTSLQFSNVLSSLLLRSKIFSSIF